ncbi:MAG: hypothetical protein GY799_33190 [Desulfobulbaceae bacterium]|nr:hypothetical protein [Desulfobulbaceae bacterium]
MDKRTALIGFVFFELFAIGMVAFALWEVWQVQAGIERGDSLLEFSTGTPYCIVGIALPLIHLIGFLKKRGYFSASTANKLCWLAFLICLPIGWKSGNHLLEETIRSGYVDCKYEGVKSLYTPGKPYKFGKAATDCPQ